MLKAELRKLYKEKRKAISPKERAALSAFIIERLGANFELKGKTISVFLPIDRFNEILTWSLLSIDDLEKGLPVLEGEDGLKHIRYTEMNQIKVSDWGIPEPQYGEEIKPEQIDLVVVPFLAIDKNGYRVGYGKGYYDRFLAQCRTDCVFVGVGYFDKFDVIDDLHESDVSLDYLITPTKIHQF